jgi:ubiquinone/menaquinone biosynthesis C-methylase UbiE
MNKEIKREAQGAGKIFDSRTLEKDYSTLPPILKAGLKVLDVGCGTGAISKGIAARVGQSGHVTGIDNTESFIISGKETYKSVSNLTLIHADIFQYKSEEKFDLIVSARTLQWLNNPAEAIIKMKSLLKPGGTISILDYNHTAIEWKPEPPASMKKYYKTFLKWRADAGMNNQVAADIAAYMEEASLNSIEVINANEVYKKGEPDFQSKIGIWSQVARSTQMVEEGYLDENDRLKAIEEYEIWIESEAQSMTMKLNEVRGRN